MVRRAWCNRAHSAVTQKVNAIEEGKVNGHAAFLKFVSGQLLFLGSILTMSQACFCGFLHESLPAPAANWRPASRQK